MKVHTKQLEIFVIALRNQIHLTLRDKKITKILKLYCHENKEKDYYVSEDLNVSQILISTIGTV